MSNGFYKVRITGATATSTGDYNFSLFEVQTSSAQLFDNVRQLSLNSEVTKTLDSGRSTHVLSFEGIASQKLMYDGMLPDGVNFYYANINVRLVGPNGEVIFNLDQNIWPYTTSSSRDSAPFVLKQTGTYRDCITRNTLPLGKFVNILSIS
jgi:hypothetical protein